MMERRLFRIGKMDCPGCASEVEQAVRRLIGVDSAKVDFVNETLEFSGQCSFDQIRTQVEALGKTISPLSIEAGRETEPVGRTGLLGFWDYLCSRQASRLAICGGALLLAALGIDLVTSAPIEIKNAAYVLAMAISMKPIAESGFNALRISRSFNISLLMTVAALGALILGEFLEAATVIFLFAIGEALEGYTADRARDSLRGLVAMKPLTANLVTATSSRPVPVEQLRVGDQIRVLSGERVPIDGNVIAGSGAIDQAHITGESVPVAVMPGAEVFAGSINGDGVLEIRVTRSSAENTLSRIIALLREAQARRAPIQRLIDRFAHVYTPTVALAALFVALVPPLFFGQPFWDSGNSTGWFYRALSMLVIACPCALAISTPVTVISALTAAARQGVLIKGGVHLEALAGIKALAFDKTGTLTEGRLEVVETRTEECEDASPCNSCDDLIAMAAAVEAQSTHPFAAAILKEAEERGTEYQPAVEVQNRVGRGVTGVVNGRQVTIGSHRFFETEFTHGSPICELARKTEAGGKSTVMLHDGERVRGFIALADTARAESRRVVDELRALGIDTMMLTGDNESVAASIAQQLGVDQYRAGMLPEEKVDAMESLRARYRQVGMIGDGINDTPALATASVGIAMGAAGSARAMETADIVLMADNLGALPKTIRRARFARRLIRENVGLSFGLKAVFLLLALTGNVTMLAAVFADMGMSLAVTLNGMRALRD